MKLVDKISLEGKKETITLTQLRDSPGDFFQQVEMGHAFTITKNGKPIAKIKPIEMNALQLGAALRRKGNSSLVRTSPFVPREEADTF